MHSGKEVIIHWTFSDKRHKMSPRSHLGFDYVNNSENSGSENHFVSCLWLFCLDSGQEVVKLECSASLLSLCMSSAIKVVLNRVLIMSRIRRHSRYIALFGGIVCFAFIIMTQCMERAASVSLDYCLRKRECVLG